MLVVPSTFAAVAIRVTLPYFLLFAGFDLRALTEFYHLGLEHLTVSAAVAFVTSLAVVIAVLEDLRLRSLGLNQATAAIAAQHLVEVVKLAVLQG